MLVYLQQQPYFIKFLLSTEPVAAKKIAQLVAYPADQFVLQSSYIGSKLIKLFVNGADEDEEDRADFVTTINMTTRLLLITAVLLSHRKYEEAIPKRTKARLLPHLHKWAVHCQDDSDDVDNRYQWRMVSFLETGRQCEVPLFLWTVGKAPSHVIPVKSCSTSALDARPCSIATKNIRSNIGETHLHHTECSVIRQCIERGLDFTTLLWSVYR